MKLFSLLKKVAFIYLITFANINNILASEIYEVKIIIQNHKFEPAIVKVPKGYKIKLVIYNNDETIEEFESKDLKREKIIPAGTHARIMIAPLEVGEYKFYGEFHEETAQGILQVVDTIKETE